MTRFLLLFSLIMVLAAPVRADDMTERLVFGVGEHNFTDQDPNQTMNEFRVELRLPRYSLWGFHPWAGLEMATKNLAWLGGGVETDIHLTDSIILTFQTGVGYYDNGTYDPPGTKFLPNSGLEFRHQLELAYAFETGHRIGIGVSHMSNANIDDHNPGMNSLNVNFHIPLEIAPALAE